MDHSKEEEKQSLRFSETVSTHPVLLDYLPNNSFISSFKVHVSYRPSEKCPPNLVDEISALNET